MNSCNIIIESHPTYIKELACSPKFFGTQCLDFIKRELLHYDRMTVFAKSLLTRSEIEKGRVGYLTTLAQFLCGLNPSDLSKYILTEGDISPSDGVIGLILVAQEILAITESVVKTSGEKLQLALTYWLVGKKAKKFGMFDTCFNCYIKAVQSYIIEKKWNQVSDLYYNLGLVAADLRYNFAVLAWLYMSADVDYSLKRNEDARKTILLTEDKKNNFPETSRIFSQEKFLECFNRIIKQNYPIGLIAAQTIDLFVIQRIYDNPEILDNLESYNSEKLLVSLFQGFGVQQVQLKRKAQDGEYDVGATFNIGDSQYKILIEIHKWQQGRSVGITTVNRFIVRYQLQDDKISIVTTSTFTNRDKNSIAKLNWEIELVDRNGLFDWIRKYFLTMKNQELFLDEVNFIKQKNKKVEIYHYTDKVGYDALTSGNIEWFPSPFGKLRSAIKSTNSMGDVNPFSNAGTTPKAHTTLVNDANYGPGWYVTDLPPDTNTRELLEKLWKGNTENLDKTAFWLRILVEPDRIDVPDEERPHVMFMSIVNYRKMTGNPPRPFGQSTSSVYLLESGNRIEMVGGKVKVTKFSNPSLPNELIKPFVFLIDGFSLMSSEIQNNICRFFKIK